MSVRKSLSIVAATRVIVFLVTMASVVIVSRLLTPAEIGLFSVSVALVGIAHVFRDFGVSQYLIQLKDVNEQHKRAAFTVTLMISWLIALGILLARGQAARFYGNAGVADVLAFTAINFIILPFGAPLKTMLQREMQFDKLAIVSLSHHSIQALVTIIAALSGASYMSLAWGSVAGTATNVLVMILISPSGALQLPTLRGWKTVFTFGSKASGASLATELGLGAPDLILGRSQGFESVGYYSRAAGLISTLLSQLLYVVRTVYVPAFAKNVRQGGDSAAYYGLATSMLLGITVPAIGLLAFLSPQLIPFMFGTQWLRSAALAQWLCAFALITAPFALAQSSLIASGHVGALLRCNVIVELCRVALLCTSFFLPLEQVVLLLGVVFLVQGAVLMQALKVSIGLSLGVLYRHAHVSYWLLPCVLLPSAATLHLLQWRGVHAHFWLLAASSVAGAVGWMAGVYCLNHPLKQDLVQLPAAASKLLRRKNRQGPG